MATKKTTSTKNTAKATSAKAKKAKPVATKKLSQFQAAIKVLTEAKEPMNCRAMVDAMQAKGYWTSPAGKTPWQTLCSAILRDIRKSKDARFVKAARGTFVLKK